MAARKKAIWPRTGGINMSHHHHNMHPYNNPETHGAESKAEAPQEEQTPDAPEAPGASDNLCASEEASMQPEAQESVEDARKELEDMRLRMAAEMDNFKKRLTREHQEQMRYAAEKVLSDLLPALDNLDLAIQYGSTHEACKDMMQGIEMTRRQLLDAVGKNGLASLGARGEDFNPAMHEAIGVESDPSLGPGAVARVLQRGYRLNDRLLRPAKVMVNN